MDAIEAGALALGGATLGGALAGGSTGAGIGALVGGIPTDGIGALPGAVAGGIIGGAIGGATVGLLAAGNLIEGDFRTGAGLKEMNNDYVNACEEKNSNIKQYFSEKNMALPPAPPPKSKFNLLWK